MATTSREKKRVRVTCKPKSCPNPLFEKWLKELKDEAARKDSKLQYVYTKVRLHAKSGGDAVVKCIHFRR